MKIFDTGSICIIQCALDLLRFSVANCGTMPWITPCRCTASKSSMTHYDEAIRRSLLTIDVASHNICPCGLQASEVERLSRHLGQQSTCCLHLSSGKCNLEYSGNSPPPGSQDPSACRRDWSPDKPITVNVRYFFDKLETPSQYWHG